MVGQDRAAVGIVIVLLLAGCLDGADLPVAAPSTIVSEALAALDAALVRGHDHTDPNLHPEAAWRIDEVFETNLPTDGAALSPPSEFILHGQYAFVSLFHPSAGFVILDLKDPERPRQVGRFDSGTAYVNDVEVSPDGRWAFIPTSPIETRENDPLDGGTVAAGDYGIQVVDVSDVTAPKLAAVWVSPDAEPRRIPTPPPADINGGYRNAVGNGYHRVDLEVIGGKLYAFGASLGFPRIDILRFEPSPVPRLEFASAYISDDGRDLAKDRGSWPGGYGIHDVTVDPDPLDGFPLMAVSHWRSGAHFVDVSDPTKPRFLGRWDGFDLDGGNVHNVEFTAIEGHRVAVAVPEYPADEDHRGAIWIVDIDDFAKPRLHGTWKLPGTYPTGLDHPRSNDVFSTNRVLLRDGTIFDAHFHAGVMVLDASTWDKAAAPELLGFIVPKGETRVPYSGVAGNPYIYDAIPRGDHLYYADLTGGFHVARMAPEVVRGNDW